MASSVWNALESGGASALTATTDPSSVFHQHLASALSTMGDAQFWEESISPATVRAQLSQATPSDQNSSHDLQNILRGLKWLLAQISKGRNVADFFAVVVKLVGIPHLEARQMVYLYLSQYADYDASTRELSLLSINAFQRGLADPEPLLRSLALRVLTSIRLPEILAIQLLAVQTGGHDPSPHVRTCAAIAGAKLAPRCRHEPEQQAVLLDMLQQLLQSDRQPRVLSAAVAALSEMAPQRLDLLHSSFRKLCLSLTDMDEWGQVFAMDALQRYCRRYFAQPPVLGTAERIDATRRLQRSVVATTSSPDPKEDGLPFTAAATTTTTTTTVTLPPHPRSAKGSAGPVKMKRRVVKKGFYSDESDTSTQEEVYAHAATGAALPSVSAAFRESRVLEQQQQQQPPNGGGLPSSTTSHHNTLDLYSLGNEDGVLAADHALLLRSALPLLKSRNASVVLGVCSLQHYCGVASIAVRASMGQALVRILHGGAPELQYVVLASIQALVQECPSAFAPFLPDFFVKPLDPPYTRIRKLDILVSLALEPSAIQAVLQELRTYLLRLHVTSDTAFCRAAVRAVGRVAEVARLVHDRHAVQESSGSSSMVQERAQANTVALNCLAGLLTLSQASQNRLLVGESVMVMQRIWQMLVSDGNAPGDLLEVNDPQHVQDRVIARILLLLTNTLSNRIREDDDEEEEAGDEADMSDDGNDPAEPTRLEQLSVYLPAAAVASALWVAGEYLSSVNASASGRHGKLDSSSRSRIRLELIRLVARCFPELEANEKEQAIHFASKLLVSKAAAAVDNGIVASPKEGPLCELVLAMGRVDVNPDTRDRARLESGLLRIMIGLQYDTDSMEALPVSYKSLSVQDAKRIFLETKPASSSLPLETSGTTTQSEESGNFRFGTLSSLVGHRARSAYIPLPPWAEENSPDSLREEPKREKNGVPSPLSGARKVHGQAASFYESSETSSSSSGDESSSSESSTDESGDGTSSDDEASSSSDESDESSSTDHADGILVPVQLDHQAQQMPLPITNGSGFSKQASTTTTEGHLADSSASSSSSSASDDDEDSSSSESSQEPPTTSGVGSLISMGAPTATSTSGHGVTDDMKGLVLAPVAVDALDEPTDPNVERDSSAWTTLVKPEHAGGLSVQCRYLRGLTKSREAQLLGLTTGKATLVVLQLRFENRKKDNGAMRRVRLVHRPPSSSSAFAPREVVVPPEVALLKAGERADCMLGIDFKTPSDRDGTLQAKFEIKTGTGSVPIEIKPLLGNLLLPCKRSLSEFDSAVGKLLGFQRVESKFSVDANVRANLPQSLLRAAAFTVTGKLAWKDNLLRLVGTLPESGDPLYVQVTCNESGKGKLVVCSDQTLAANSIMNLMKRAVSDASC